jgi:hypothetical protein
MNSDYVLGGRNTPVLFANSSAPERLLGGRGYDTAEYMAADAAETARVEGMAEGMDAGSTEYTGESSSSTSGIGQNRNRGPEAFEHELSFDDLVDMVNPLQHIPLVNVVYRAISGDTISGVSQIVGGGIYGGVLGVFTSVASALFEQETGRGVGETMVAALVGEDYATPGAGGTMLADGDDAPATEADYQKGPMLAEAEMEEAPVQQASNAEKQPFGGVLQNGPMENVAEAKAPKTEKTAEKAPEAAMASAVPPAAPASASSTLPAAAFAPLGAPAPAQAQKFYSLANAPRINTPAQMPLPNSLDVRLKPVERQAVHSQKAMQQRQAEQAAAEALMGQQQLPLASKDAARAALGLGDDTEGNSEIASVAGADSFPSPSPRSSLPGRSAIQPAIPHSIPGGNALPPQLIEDMMMMNLQKYQNMDNSRGAKVDIRG